MKTTRRALFVAFVWVSLAGCGGGTSPSTPAQSPSSATRRPRRNRPGNAGVAIGERAHEHIAQHLTGDA